MVGAPHHHKAAMRRPYVCGAFFGWNDEGVLRLNGVGAGEEVLEAAERLGRGKPAGKLDERKREELEQENGGAALGGRAPPS